MKKQIIIIVGFVLLLTLVACGHANRSALQNRESMGLASSSQPTRAITTIASPTAVIPTFVPPTVAPTSVRPPSSPTSPSTLQQALVLLRQALERQDVSALSPLMLQQVRVGAYATDNVWYANAPDVASALVKGSGSTLKCWYFSEGMGGASLVLTGFRFPHEPLTPWQISDGAQVQGVEFVFDDNAPYWITMLIPITIEVTKWPKWGIPWGCEQPADQIFAVAAQPSSENISSGDCWSAPTPRLKVGQYAYVSLTPPTPNRIRETPSRQGAVIGWAKPGRKMKVLEGPVCSDGWAWWRVQLIGSNLTGWTAEGDGNEYWLIPCVTLNDCP